MTQKSQSSARYLWKRGNVWWFRMHVPKRFQTPNGPKVITESLETSDKLAASLAAGKKRAQLFELWSAERQVCAVVSHAEVGNSVFQRPSEFELEAVALELAYENMREKLGQLTAANAQDKEAHSAWVGAKQYKLEEYTRKYVSGDWMEWLNVADRAILKRRWRIDTHSQSYREFTKLIAQFSIEALRVSIQHSLGKLGEVPQGSEIEKAYENRSKLAPIGQKLPELFALYEVQLGREGGLVSIDERKRILNQFSQFIGAERGLESIQKSDIREFVNALADAPKGYAKRADFTGLELKAAVIKGAELGLAKRSTVTVNKDLSFLSSFFKWCRQANYVDNNPCEGFAYKIHWTHKAESQRPPFNDDEINKIFQSPLFRENGGDGKEHILGTMRNNDWRKWVPLICLFTGARATEVAQLYTDDIFEVQGVWVLRFKSVSHRNTRIKTPGSERLIPIHSLLENIGFLNFVRLQIEKTSGQPAQLFENLKPDNRGVMGAAPSKFFRQYLERIGVKEPGSDGRGTHSFRHSISDALRSAGFYDLEFGSAILGHSNKSMTSKYGQIPQGTLTKRKAMIEAISFEGIDLAHLFSPEQNLLAN